MSFLKSDYKKDEKHLYLPGNHPERIVVPAMNFFTIRGAGNPNDAFFAEYISVLYSLSYAVKMSPKSGRAPACYFDYTVYPLEGVWDLTEEGRSQYQGTINKDELVFTLMMRQPGFITEDFALEMIRLTQKKKPHALLPEVRFETICDGPSVQMMHLGSYDSEPASFRQMENFARENHLKRKSMTHREIYLSDARKVAADKLRTVLRFQVEGMHTLCVE